MSMRGAPGCGGRGGVGTRGAVLVAVVVVTGVSELVGVPVLSGETAALSWARAAAGSGASIERNNSSAESMAR